MCASVSFSMQKYGAKAYTGGNVLLRERKGERERARDDVSARACTHTHTHKRTHTCVQARMQERERMWENVYVRLRVSVLLSMWNGALICLVLPEF